MGKRCTLRHTFKCFSVIYSLKFQPKTISFSAEERSRYQTDHKITQKTAEVKITCDDQVMGWRVYFVGRLGHNTKK